LLTARLELYSEASGHGSDLLKNKEKERKEKRKEKRKAKAKKRKEKIEKANYIVHEVKWYKKPLVGKKG
jgi:hypothetical protein